MIQKQSNWTIPFLFLWWRHRNYVMFQMTSSIKFWKPQVTDWNLINSEHHFRLEKRTEPRRTAATLSRYVFAVMTSHEILSSTLETPRYGSDPRYGDEKVVCLFLFWLNLFIFDVTNVPISVNAVHGGKTRLRSTIKRNTAWRTQSLAFSIT